MNANNVKSFLRAEFQREMETHFALLQRIPCASIRQFLDYFKALNSNEQNALAEALAEIALTVFFPSTTGSNPCDITAHKKYRDAVPRIWDLKYQDTQTLRMLLVEAEKKPEYSRRVRGMTPEIMEKIRAIKPVKSTEIRKVVKMALSQLFSDFSAKQEAGLWHYRGKYQNTEVCVDINYAARYTQLFYEISVSDNTRGINLKGLSYERLMGLSVMGWNCLEQANLDQSIALLKDLILYCVELPKRLPE